MEEQIKPIDVAKKYGLIYALVSVVINIIPLIVENTDQGISFLITLLNVVVAMVFFILAGREFKRNNGGYMTFGEAFRINMTAVTIMAVCRAGMTYLYIKVIDTTYSERIMTVMEDTWETQGMNEAQIDQAKSWASLFVNPEAMLFMALLVPILGGLIWGAIAAAIVKNDEDEF